MIGLAEVLEEDLLVLGHAFQPNTCRLSLFPGLDFSFNLRKNQTTTFPLFIYVP